MQYSLCILVNPVTCSSILCRLQHPEDVSKKIPVKQEKQQRRSFTTDQTLIKQSETHETGEHIGITNVSYDQLLTNQKEKRRLNVNTVGVFCWCTDNEEAFRNTC